MESNVIYQMVRAFLLGFIDSFKGGIALFYLDSRLRQRVADEKKKLPERGKRSKHKEIAQLRDGKVLKRVLQCCGLNGGIFWASLLFFDYLLVPTLKFLLFYLMGHSEMASSLGEYSEMIIRWTFRGLWVMPLYLLSKFVNTLWFQDIADSAFMCTAGKTEFFTNLSKFFADTLFSIIIQVLFLIQAVIVNYFPIEPFGYVLYIIHTSMLYSLYAFEYKWCKIGWELHRRLVLIETNWPYFIGFGLPLAFVVSYIESYVYSACLFSIIFPLFIISANDAKPIENTSGFHLPLFNAVVKLSNVICGKILKWMN